MTLSMIPGISEILLNFPYFLTSEVLRSLATRQAFAYLIYVDDILVVFHMC